MPKRIGNLKNKLISMDTFYQAFAKGTEHKKTDDPVRRLWTEEAQQNWIPKSGMSTKGYLDPDKVKAFGQSILKRLSAGSYKHKKPRHKHMYCTSKSKGTTGGKWREIYCPDLDDHIDNHRFMDELNGEFPKDKARRVISDDAKRRVFRTA